MILTLPSGFRYPSYTFHMSSGPAEHTSLPTSNRLTMLLVASTWAPWLTDDDDVCDLSLENMAPAADGADGRLLPRRKSDQPILRPDVVTGWSSSLSFTAAGTRALPTYTWTVVRLGYVRLDAVRTTFAAAVIDRYGVLSENGMQYTRLGNHQKSKNQMISEGVRECLGEREMISSFFSENTSGSSIFWHS